MPSNKLFFKQNIIKFCRIYQKNSSFFTNVCGLPHFLPQPPNIFTQIYLPYLWHFATLGAAWDNLVRWLFSRWASAQCWWLLHHLWLVINIRWGSLLISKSGGPISISVGTHCEYLPVMSLFFFVIPSFSQSLLPVVILCFCSIQLLFPRHCWWYAASWAFSMVVSSPFLVVTILIFHTKGVKTGPKMVLKCTKNKMKILP